MGLWSAEFLRNLHLRQSCLLPSFTQSLDKIGVFLCVDRLDHTLLSSIQRVNIQTLDICDRLKGVEMLPAHWEGGARATQKKRRARKTDWKRGRGGNSFSPHPFFFPPRPSRLVFCR